MRKSDRKRGQDLFCKTANNVEKTNDGEVDKRPKQTNDGHKLTTVIMRVQRINKQDKSYANER
jgi:hypothetical protein